MSLRVKIGFGVLCLASGSRWLLDQVWPGDLPALLRVALHRTLLLAVIGGFVFLRGMRIPRSWWRIAVWMGVLFFLPGMLAAGAGGKVAGLTEALVGMLVPVVVVFTVSQMRSGFGVEDGARNLLGPAVAGIAGAWLVIPSAMPGSAEGKVWLAGLVVSAVLAGLAAVRLHALLRGVPVLAGAMVACAVTALGASLGSFGSWHVLGAVGWQSIGVEVGIALLVEGPLLLLTVWLLRDLAPVRLSARYGMVLLVTIAETALLMRPQLGWALIAGLVLMLVSCVWLLRADLDESPAASAG